MLSDEIFDPVRRSHHSTEYVFSLTHMQKAKLFPDWLNSNQMNFDKFDKELWLYLYKPEVIITDDVVLPVLENKQ